ncbi:hypothetical protein E0L36_13905 [Streptomyces sp. AJS327]|uniref:hypothetical protein n=1 Tax=Streptomyces sp. AJS327 TaxID=2545265 RepID=UPI0015DF64B1|nr:hypothetical protein [Streptomyces sp. AJS327]MBA0051949.1 hypothetical protein [Streptomyces sp. AJS327]
MHVTIPRHAEDQSASKVLATAQQQLAAAITAGQGDRVLSPIDFFARIARRQHGTDLPPARRALAVALGPVSSPHVPVTVRQLATRISGMKAAR